MAQFWEQVASQAVAFILFAVVLRVFAWGPVTAFLEERRRKIQADIDRADTLARDSEARQKELEERLSKIEDEARQRIQEAAGEGRKAAEAITEEARADGRAIREHAQQMAQIEFAKAMQQVKDDVVKMTISATERLMREQMDETRQREMVGRFLDELEKN